MKQFNILTDALPETVTLFETEYPVHTSFRNWIRISELVKEAGRKDGKSIAKALKLCYKETLPPNIVSAFLGMLSFLSRGTDFSVSRGESAQPLFSFQEDAEVIYSAFYSKYGIDLVKEDLHWYSFCALMSSLSADNAFKTLLDIRSFDEKKLKNPEKRRKMAQLKEKFGLKAQGGKREVDVAENLAALF